MKVVYYMSLNEIEIKIAELKMEYLRIQGDIERLESLGHSFEKLEIRLEEIENELQHFHSKK